MQKTFLEKNSFYILEVLPSDKRASIISKAEEQSFFDDGNECDEAQAILINPIKRLYAELDWFFDISANVQAEIVENIKNKKEICIDELTGLSRLNAMLHNFLVIDFDDYFEIGYAILEIDEMYDNLNSSNICNVINKYRTQAGIASISDDDIAGALNKKRATIRQTITERLDSLSESDYVELVSMIAEKCIAEDTYNNGVVIDDVVDQYEIRMKSVIDEKMDVALSMIVKEDANTNKSAIDLTVEKLINTLKEFDKYAQPLQIKSSTEGSDHSQSLHLARECREFAIKLHNEYDNSDASFKLIHALNEIFPELIEFSEIISNDEKQLNKIKEEKEQFKKDIETHRQADKEYTVNIQGDRFAIPPFCTCCMKPTSNKENVSYSMTTQHGNTKTTRSIAVDLPICDECLKHRSRYNWLLTLICSISIAVGGFFMAILMIAGMDGFLSFLLGTGVAVGVYFGVSAIWKTTSLAKEHARRGKSASIFSLFMNNFMSRQLPNCSGVTFTFYNWEYAHLFREANKDKASDVKESTELNTAKSTSVLKANEHPVANMFKMIGVFIVVALIIGSVISSSNSGSNYTNTNNKTNNNYQSKNSYQSNDNSSSSVKTYIITFDKQNGTGGTSSVNTKYGEKLPYATAPTRSGYDFQGYFSQTNGLGTKYYDSNMNAVTYWYGNSSETIYAYWIEKTTNNSSNGINVTKENFEDYFTLTTDAEFIGDTVTITYSIKPKSNAYAKSSDSSSTISVQLGGVVSQLSVYFGEPSWNKKHTVTLNKSQNYTASGSFSFDFYAITDTVYWLADVTYCSGTIGN